MSSDLFALVTHDLCHSVEEVLKVASSLSPATLLEEEETIKKARDAARDLLSKLPAAVFLSVHCPDDSPLVGTNKLDTTVCVRSVSELYDAAAKLWDRATEGSSTWATCGLFKVKSEHKKNVLTETFTLISEEDDLADVPSRVSVMSIDTERVQVHSGTVGGGGFATEEEDAFGSPEPHEPDAGGGASSLHRMMKMLENGGWDAISEHQANEEGDYAYRKRARAGEA